MGSGQFGQFLGTVKAEWIDPDRHMKLLADFVYIDPNGNRWLAPRGSEVDGASIPRAFWSLAGSPFTGAYRNASVVHDVACVERNKSWQAVHRMFYNACRCGGVAEVMAKMMFAAVFHFGPRWGEAAQPRFGGGAPKRPAITFEDLRLYIEQNDPSLEEIEAFNVRGPC